MLTLSNIALREELRQQAIRDPLTGLYNRRYLEETLTRELNRAKRLNIPLCVSMLDIDHFKVINDTLGHTAGDALLRQLGHTLRENLRSSDIACRYGGDEFVLIMPDSSLDDTRRRLQQILELVKALRAWTGDQLHAAPTMSAGIAMAGEHNFNEREILRAADEALYAAKQAGRDLVIIDHSEKGLTIGIGSPADNKPHFPQMAESKTPCSADADVSF
jgi:diguanylate cyclase (GGDEF)-like protein